MTCKIVALTDALGNPVAIELLPGQRHDSMGVAALIEGRSFGGLIADAAFDANWILEEMDRRRAESVIEQHPNRTAPRDIDRHIYRWRHLIENFFQKIKEFRRIATRYDKTDKSFQAFLYACSTIINTR